MGLEVHIFPIEEVITLKRLRSDENLIVEDGEMIYIKLKDTPESAIGLYSKEDIVDYARIWNCSKKVLRYIAETYDALLGADGFLDDAGYMAIMEGMGCKDADELISLTVEYYVDEMLKYNEVYEWSPEFQVRLKELKENFMKK